MIDKQQTPDQTGFQIDDTLVVLESFSSKPLEWNDSLRFVSVEVARAFDRIEYTSLREALLEQGGSTLLLQVAPET